MGDGVGLWSKLRNRRTSDRDEASPERVPLQSWAPPSRTTLSPSIAVDGSRVRHDGSPVWYVDDSGPLDRFNGPAGLPLLYLARYVQDGEEILRLVESPTGLLLGPTNRRLPPIGIFSGTVRGMKYYSEASREADLRPGVNLQLLRQPENPFDSNAVAIAGAAGEIVGYVNKGKARQLAKVLDAGVVLEAISLRGTPPGQVADQVVYLAASPDVMEHLRAGRPDGTPIPVFQR